MVNRKDKLRTWYKSKFFEDISVFTLHEEESIGLLQKRLKEFCPELIIELGTANGGLTLALHESCKDVPLYSFDKHMIQNNKKKHEAVTDEDIVRLLVKGFNKNVTLLKGNLISSPNERLIKLIKDDRKKFLYCDNGGKVKEILMYSRYLSLGDMIGVHDWGEPTISYKTPGIKEALSCFTEDTLNNYFEKKKLTTRLWIRTKES